MNDFELTPKQKQALKLLGGNEKHDMLFGGSRSGKTFLIVRSIIIRACKTQSRHISLRHTFNSIKTSIWCDTLPKVMRLCFPDLAYELNKTDYYMTLPNGSEYWIGGLDDDKRTEKILGKEFSTIHFNECSQLRFESVQMALTRLAEKNSLKKKVYYDMNPPSKRSWTYWQFIKKINPVDSIPIANESDYVSIIMNPIENMQNIDSDYLSLLDSLPEKQRMRFRDGIFVDDDDGLAYYGFNRDRHTIENIQQQSGTIFIGMDFNVNPMTAIVCQYLNNKFYIFDEIYLENSDTFKMCMEIKARGYSGASVIPDSTGANRKTSGMSDHIIIKNANLSLVMTFNPFVRDRVNNINRLFQDDKILISKKCKKLIADLEQVAWKNDQLDQTTNKMLTHISDCLGYVCYKLDAMGKAKTQIYSSLR